MELRYQNKIQELSDNYQRQISDLQEKKAKLEKELKFLNERSLLESYGKIGSQNIIEKKVSDLMENEKKLLGEIDELKNDRDNKIMEFQSKLDLETETLKSKLKELEMKFKDSDNKKNLLMFEHEKEKAKWNLEKDYISNQRIELQDQINKLEKKKEDLLRQNEKMKNDAKSNRRLVTTTSALNAMGAFNSSSNILKPNNFASVLQGPSPSKAAFSSYNTENKIPLASKAFEQFKLSSFEAHLKNASLNKSNVSSGLLSDQDAEENVENINTTSS